MLDTCPDQRRDDPPAPPDVRGDFEVHLTVEPGAVEALAAWADGHGLKFTHILLARGAVPSQPMLTLRADGTLAEVAAETSRTAGRLARAGFTVLRAKIEATPWAQGVPVSDEDAERHGAGRYFEHHVKLLLAGPAATADLTELAVRHGAHLSRNPRRVREDGRYEWFVTQRCRLVGLDTAGRRLEALLGDLAADGREAVSVEREFVVVDSDEALDAGWITEHEYEHEHEGEHGHGRSTGPYAEGNPR
ncbi:hypothetical protein [Streptomyces sp. FH025]|uniref:hypothetical protein n=1 Tax=Streptomyces sp. FH025 TaxID=2815937 RepID=UPI001A9D2558|nr:hypothetical protein [Streptomyces sp. FH025]MBO1414724.1 hypothetical protein [Streptomyces sp. FH025]